MDETRGTTPGRSGLRRRRVLLVVAVVLTLGAATALAVQWQEQDGERATKRSDRAAEQVTESGRAARLPGTVLETITVASYNLRRQLSYADQQRDWDRITARADLDLIGWQEATTPAFLDLYPRYRARGWETWVAPEKPISPAFSWRSKVFTLLGVKTLRMHRGADPSKTDAPFPARWVVQARLRHRPTGRVVTLLNTHVNQTIETGDEFEQNLNAKRAKRHYRQMATMWNSVPGDVVIGTGDYNFDYYDDTAARPAGGMSRRFEGRALSSFEALGIDELVPTRNTRWVSYVYLSTDSVRGPGGRGDQGTAQFAAHRTLDGYSSDHRPLVARIRLYR